MISLSSSSSGRTSPAFVSIESVPAAGRGAIGISLPETIAGTVACETGSTISGSLGALEISGEGMFASGSDQLDPEFVPLMERIGTALETQPGRAVITGHTDNVPVTKSLRFPSNYHLSVARAETVKVIVVSKLSDPSRVASGGRGETEPVADNKTPEGRKRNRRIELIVQKPEEGAAQTTEAPTTQ